MEIHDLLASGKVRNLVDILEQRSVLQANEVCYEFLYEDGHAESLTYSELYRDVAVIAAKLQASNLTNQYVLLFYAPGLDYIRAFLASLHAGAIPMPVYLPTNAAGNAKVRCIIQQVQPRAILSTAKIHARLTAVNSDFSVSLPWCMTDQVEDFSVKDYRKADIRDSDIALLQFTSGSTSAPKGVMITHHNLMHNLKLIYESFGNSQSVTRGVIWLPPFHDMGLIGGILEPLYGGIPVFLMTPIDFLRSPFKWLELITEKKATSSGGPNFAYDLCVRKITEEEKSKLDLSSWQLAFCAAEPIRVDTLKAFEERFRDVGFRWEAFFPCYGLAEATLFVSGGPATAAPRVATSPDGGEKVVVGCGQIPPDVKVRIVPENTVGEVWVASDSVATGYFGQDGLPDPKHFLRTGDLGFVLENELFITGRMKDLIIIRGKNIYPQDVEVAVSAVHADLDPYGAVAFAIDRDDEEHLVVVQEVNRGDEALFPKIAEEMQRRIARDFGVGVYDIVLLRRRGIPRTTSGKLQRRATRELYRAGSLRPLYSSRQIPNAADDLVELTVEALARMDGPLREKALMEYLKSAIARLRKTSPASIDSSQNVEELGLDSLQLVELKLGLDQMMGQPFDLETFSEKPDIATLAKFAAKMMEHPPIPIARMTRMRRPEQRMETYSVLTDFQTLSSEKSITQEDFRKNIRRAILAQSESAQEDEVTAFVDRHTVSSDQISRRLFEFPSFYTRSEAEMEASAFDISEEMLDSRMQYFDASASRIFKEFYTRDENPPDDLIHVTCCGYVSPSPAQKLVSDYAWPSIVTHSYHMGCAGAFPAVRMASGFMAASHLYTQKSKIDLVHTELVSVHATSAKGKFDAEALIVKSLFGDGVIKYSLISEDRLPVHQSGLKILALRQRTFPATQEDMTWRLSSEEFRMTLSRRVPLVMGTNIEAFSREIFGQLGVEFDDVRRSMVLALHPGGPRMVDFIQQCLKLEDWQVCYSRDILRQYGNMSSATVPYIWKAILEDRNIAKGTTILSIGFGPGLEAHGMVGEKV